jgi:UDP-glucose 4-epimerase
MKRVLVIGENSYIGKSFQVFAEGRYEIKMASSRNEAWREADFTGYDSVLHCAGIAHVSRNPKMEALYYEVNCDLTVAIAEKAKKEGIKQFVFLSSILVYGSSKAEIDVKTVPQPDDFYGASKLKAEQELQKLVDDDFKICLVRLPLVYGEGCKGNFPRLIKLAKKSPLFPDYPNKRSMIYVENLMDFLGKIIDDGSAGIFLPQNNEHVNTSELVKCLAEAQGKRIATTKLFNPLLKTLAKRLSVFQKMFGDLYYVLQNENVGDDVHIVQQNKVTFKDSIMQSVGHSLNDKKCLIVASVASMIGQFNMPNIALLQAMGYKVAVAANFSFGNTFGGEHAGALLKTLKEQDIEVYETGFVRNVFSPSNIAVFKQVKKIINSNDYSLIHCHSPIGGVITRLAAKKKRQAGTRVIYTAHGFYFHNNAPLLYWLLFYPIEKWLSRYTDVLITINNEDFLIAARNMRAKKTVYLPGVGIETKKFLPSDADRFAKRKELNIPSDAIVVISTGELS